MIKSRKKMQNCVLVSDCLFSLTPWVFLLGLKDRINTLIPCARNVLTLSEEGRFEYPQQFLFYFLLESCLLRATTQGSIE